jgi:hypothetical protein
MFVRLLSLNYLPFPLTTETTIQGLQKEMKRCSDALAQGSKDLLVSSTSQLLESEIVKKWKTVEDMKLQVGKIALEDLTRPAQSRQRITRESDRFFTEGTVLLHSFCPGQSPLSYRR